MFAQSTGRHHPPRVLWGIQQAAGSDSTCRWSSVCWRRSKGRHPSKLSTSYLLWRCPWFRLCACAPLMCCVLGWNAVTIEDYDGGPNVSRHIVTVEGAYIFICWEPVRPCYTMEQCPTVQHMLNLARWFGNVWWQTGPDSVRQNGFRWCSRHECVVKESRWVATQLETEWRLSVLNGIGWDNEVL